jgi:hypothetical protein
MADKKLVVIGANGFPQQLQSGDVPVAPTAALGTDTTQIATTAFVQSTIRDLDSKPYCAYATAAALPSNTYSNGSSGVGATLTGTANGPLIVDSATIVTGALGLRVLVKNEAAQANNGWYEITQVGVVAVSPYILTRATGSDQAAEIAPGYLTGIEAPTGLTAGSVNNGKVFISVCPSPFVVGTDSLNFSSVSGGAGDVVGPSSAVNGNVALFDGVTGKLIKDGGTLGTAAFVSTTLIEALISGHVALRV